MNKNKKIIITSIVVVLIIVVGGAFGFLEYRNNKVKKIVDKGIGYLNQKEYEKATTTFDLALDEKSNDNEALELKNMVDKYLEAKKLFDSGDAENANKLINEIRQESSSYKEFESDINKLNEQINSYNKNIKEIDNNITKVRSLINEGKYNDAKDVIEKLEKDKLSNIQKEQVSDLKGRVNSELDKQQLEKKAKEQKPVTENKTQNENNNKICDTKYSMLKSKQSGEALKIAMAFRDKIGMESISARGVTEIPGVGKDGWSYIVTDPGEVLVYVDDYGNIYVLSAGETIARKESL